MMRFSIAGLLGFVAVFAVGLASLVNPTTVWAGVAFTMTLGVLLTSVLGIVLGGWRRGGLLGFTLFGWGYFLLVYLSFLGLGVHLWHLPDAAADWVFSMTNPSPTPPEWVAYSPTRSRSATPTDMVFYAADSYYKERSMNAVYIGRWLSVLLFAEAGAIVGAVLTRGRRADEPAVPLA